MSSAQPVIENVAGWPVLPLADVTTILRRGTAPVYVEASDVLAIGQRCVTSREFVASYARPHWARSTKNVLVPQQGDVLINSTGTGTIGRSVVFREQTGRYIVDGHVTVARPKPDMLVPRWLNDTLRSPPGQQYLESRCYTGSTNQVELSSSALADFAMAMPPLEEQRRIAEVLNALDDEIRATTEIIHKLLLAREGAVRDVLDHGIDSSGKPRDTNTSAGQFKQTMFGMLPSGWGTLSIEEACSVVVDCPHSTPSFLGAGVLVARTTNIKSGNFIESSASYVSEVEYNKRIARAEPMPGDIILTREAPVGEAFVIPNGMRICLGQRVMLLRPRMGLVNPYYLLAQLYSGKVKERIELLTAGTTNPHLNVAEVKRFKLPMPSYSEQMRIAAFVDAYDAQIRCESARLEKQRTLKWGLTSDLLSGRVRVPQKVVS